jgi:hypothetical protein
MNRIDYAISSFSRYDAAFLEGSHGESEVEAEISGVVEGRCEEFAGVCEESVVGHPGGEEVEAIARSSRTEGHETEG